MALTDYAPALALVDMVTGPMPGVAPAVEITDPCGCNQPREKAFHQRGDAAFCRATLAAGVGYDGPADTVEHVAGVQA